MSYYRVHTLESLREYLCTWFTTITPTDYSDIIEIGNESYVLVASFVRMNTFHGMYVDLSTGKYLFALDGKYVPHLFPYIYNSYRDLLDGIATIYEKIWDVSRY